MISSLGLYHAYVNDGDDDDMSMDDIDLWELHNIVWELDRVGWGEFNFD